MLKRETAPAPVGEDERRHADHHRRGRHQNGPQAHRGRLLDRAAPRVAAGLLQPVGEIDHQDAVLGDEADQRDEADLRIDVDAGEAEESADVERQKGAEQSRRQGDENDERIAEALVLRRQHEIDDDEREHEHIDERVALLLVLAGIALEVIGVAFRKDLFRFRGEEIERFAERAAGERHARQGGGIELLEAGQRVGLHVVPRQSPPPRAGTSSPFLVRT